MLSLKRDYLRFFDFLFADFLATLRFVVRLADFLLATFFFFFAIALTSSHSNVYDVNYFYILHIVYDDLILGVNVNRRVLQHHVLYIFNKKIVAYSIF